MPASPAACATAPWGQGPTRRARARSLWRLAADWCGQHPPRAPRTLLSSASTVLCKAAHATCPYRIQGRQHYGRTPGIHNGSNPNLRRAGPVRPRRRRGARSWRPAPTTRERQVGHASIGVVTYDFGSSEHAVVAHPAAVTAAHTPKNARRVAIGPYWLVVQQDSSVAANALADGGVDGRRSKWSVQKWPSRRTAARPIAAAADDATRRRPPQDVCRPRRRRTWWSGVCGPRDALRKSPL